jgi:hypothetical protein
MAERWINSIDRYQILFSAILRALVVTLID